MMKKFKLETYCIMITVIIIFIFLLIPTLIENIINANYQHKHTIDWIMISITLASAVIIPFLYNYIVQNNKRRKLKEFWKSRLRMIESIVDLNDEKSKNSIKQIFLDLEEIESYVIEVYSVGEFGFNMPHIRMIKDTLKKYDLETNDAKIPFENIKNTIIDHLEKLINEN